MTQHITRLAEETGRAWSDTGAAIAITLAAIFLAILLLITRR